MSKSRLSTFELHRANECQVRLINESARVWVGNWDAAEAFRVPIYGGLTGHRSALIVGSGSAGRQPGFSAKDEYPSVSVI
jgi:hypothetical protein